MLRQNYFEWIQFIYKTIKYSRKKSLWCKEKNPITLCINLFWWGREGENVYNLFFIQKIKSSLDVNEINSLYGIVEIQFAKVVYFE